MKNFDRIGLSAACIAILQICDKSIVSACGQSVFTRSQSRCTVEQIGRRLIWVNNDVVACRECSVRTPIYYTNICILKWLGKLSMQWTMSHEPGECKQLCYSNCSHWNGVLFHRRIRDSYWHQFSSIHKVLVQIHANNKYLDKKPIGEKSG